jgi:hypothetical protein
MLLLAAIHMVLNVDGHGADRDCSFSIGTSRLKLSRVGCRRDGPG